MKIDNIRKYFVYFSLFAILFSIIKTALFVRVTLGFGITMVGWILFIAVLFYILSDAEKRA
ncbi:MAG: hypothetical protein AAB922_01495 [Patescibacteria group bacterium]